MEVDIMVVIHIIPTRDTIEAITPTDLMADIIHIDLMAEIGAVLMVVIGMTDIIVNAILFHSKKETKKYLKDNLNKLSFLLFQKG